MRKTKYTKEKLEQVVKDSTSLAGVFRLLGISPTGGNYTYIGGKISSYGINTDHFTGSGWNVGLQFNPNPPIDTLSLLVENSTYQSSKLRLRLIRDGFKEAVCECCGLTSWNNVPIPLELHHLNGIHTDNRLSNIQLLCPNCHALTESFSNKKTSS